MVNVQGHCCFCPGEYIWGPLGLRGCPGVSAALCALLYVPQSSGEVLGNMYIICRFQCFVRLDCIIHSYHRLGLGLLLSMLLLWYFRHSLCFPSHIHSNECRKKFQNSIYV